MSNSKEVNAAISRKSKLIGSAIIGISSILLYLVANALFNVLPTFWFLLCVGALMLFYIPALMIAQKLIRLPHEIVVSSETILKRVQSHRYETKHPKYPTIVYFCGIDGCGKTTQVDMLKKTSVLSRLAYSHVNLRFVAFLSYPFFAFCRLTGYTQWKYNSKGTWVSEYYFYRNKALSNLYIWLFTIDMFVLTNLKVKSLLWRGNIVLSDRCSIDGLVDLMADTKEFDLWKKAPGRLMLSLVSRNATIILFDLDAKTAFDRKNDVTNVEFLTTRRMLYLQLAKQLNMHVVDASEPVEVLAADLAAVLSHKPLWHFGGKKENK